MINIIVMVVTWTRLRCIKQLFGSTLSKFYSEAFDIFGIIFFLCGFIVDFLLDVLLRHIILGFYPTLG
jgi:hypothetical protein